MDQFDQEFSRDIEPMKGGHGDNYYWQLVANVRRFKGAPPLPQASRPKTIRIAGGFEQWHDVAPEFADHVGRDGAARFARRRRALTTPTARGRNDLVGLQGRARQAERVFLRPHARSHHPRHAARTGCGC